MFRKADSLGDAQRGFVAAESAPPLGSPPVRVRHSLAVNRDFRCHSRWKFSIHP